MSNDNEFTPKGEDEIRQQVIEDYDFDEEKDGERIEKLTKREVEAQEDLGTAIKQKKTQRDSKEKHEAKLKELGYDPETGEKLETEEEKKKKKEADKKKGSDEPTEREKKRDEEIDALKMENAGDFSEDVQKNIKEFAKMEGVSYKEAAKSDYIKHKLAKETEKKENEEAANGDGKGNKMVSNDKASKAEPEDFKNLTDEQWAKKKEALRKES